LPEDSFNICVQCGCLCHSWQIYFQMRYSTEPNSKLLVRGSRRVIRLPLATVADRYGFVVVASILLGRGYWKLGRLMAVVQISLYGIFSQSKRYLILDSHSRLFEVTFQVLLSRVIRGRTNSSCAFQIAEMVFPIHTLDHHSPAR
jgi:hypothetical protein